MIVFDKMSGAGNDFIVIDNRENVVSMADLPGFVKKICRRGLSVGADGVFLIEDSDQVDFRWQFFNSDGSVAEMCGNAARCAARFAFSHGIAGEKMAFETLAGIVEARVIGDVVRIKMTEPFNIDPDDQLVLKDGIVSVGRINTGVPHVVMETDDLKTVDVLSLGREIRRHPAFEPAGTNVNFVQCMDDGSVGIRTYERGVEDETLACGTGNVAAAIILSVQKGLNPPVTLRPKGGSVLKVDFSYDRGKYINVYLEGDARLIYTGKLNPEAWEYNNDPNGNVG